MHSAKVFFLCFAGGEKEGGDDGNATPKSADDQTAKGGGDDERATVFPKLQARLTEQQVEGHEDKNSTHQCEPEGGIANSFQDENTRQIAERAGHRTRRQPLVFHMMAIRVRAVDEQKRGHHRSPWPALWCSRRDGGEPA